MTEEILIMRNISKNFIGVKALDKVDFTLRQGEIHALMGENGAGKSTLIKVLTGALEFESGTINISGIKNNIINKSPKEAQEYGISTVYQEINLCPNLTVAENIFVGREPKKYGFVDWKEMNKRAENIMKSLNIDISVNIALENYSVAIQQMVAIARAVDISSKVLILDEPTSSLDDIEVKKLFEVMLKLKKSGIGIIFVTHFLEQVYEVCDRITVLRNGSLVGEYEIKNLPRVQLVAKMLGKEFDELASIKNKKNILKDENLQDVFLEAKHLGCEGTIKPFDLTVNKGEIIGLSGLLGSGRSEMARVLFGADKKTEGIIEILGKEKQINDPLDAMKEGISFLPEDRKKEGIIGDLSVRENIIIALQAKRGMFKLLSKKDQKEFVDYYIDLLNIKTASSETPIKQLSGGNQQKVILGRMLLTDPKFLILDEPTRGIDVGTKTEIQKLILKLSDDGMAVMFISSEIEEMLRTVDKMYILRDRELVDKLYGDDLNESFIMSSIAGGEKNEK